MRVEVADRAPADACSGRFSQSNTSLGPHHAGVEREPRPRTASACCPARSRRRTRARGTASLSSSQKRFGSKPGASASARISPVTRIERDQRRVARAGLAQRLGQRALGEVLQPHVERELDRLAGARLGAARHVGQHVAARVAARDQLGGRRRAARGRSAARARTARGRRGRRSRGSAPRELAVRVEAPPLARAAARPSRCSAVTFSAVSGSHPALQPHEAGAAARAASRARAAGMPQRTGEGARGGAAVGDLRSGQPATDSTVADTANTVPRRSTQRPRAAPRARPRSRPGCSARLASQSASSVCSWTARANSAAKRQQPHDRDHVDAARPQARAAAPSPAGALHRFAPAATSRCARAAGVERDDLLGLRVDQARAPCARGSIRSGAASAAASTRRRSTSSASSCSCEARRPSS